MTRKPSTAAPILAALAVVLALLGAYVGGYFACVVEDHTNVRFRVYRYEWQAAAFEPVAILETWLTGDRTMTEWDN